MAIADDEVVGSAKPQNPTEFVKAYGAIAAKVGQEIGVDPAVLLAKWGMETGWGKHIVGEHNLGNIKDMTGQGKRGYDKQENSNDAYLSFEDPEGWARYYSDFIKRGYPNAMNTGSDISKFVTGLSNGVNGSYFGRTDPQKYQDAVSGAHQLASKIYGAPQEHSSEGSNPGVGVPPLPSASNPVNDPKGSPEPAEISPFLGLIPGAKYGSLAGAGLAVADAKFNAASGVKEAWDALRGRSAPTVPTPAAPTPVTPVAPPVAIEPRVAAATPKHGGENWVKALTSVDIPDAQMSKADLDTAKGMKTAVGRAGEPGFTGGTITKGGVIITPQAAAELEKRVSESERLANNARLMREAKARIANQAAEQSRAAEAAMLARGEAQAAQAAAHAPVPSSPLWQYAKRLASFPVRGALAGAGAGFSALDFMNRYNRKDMSGAAIAGLGGVAGTIAPFVASAGALPAISMAAPLYLMAEDRIRYLKKHPEAQTVSEDIYDPMGNIQR
jgi:flagellum-specific peptidoglycan hydrolase FlgJ